MSIAKNWTNTIKPDKVLFEELGRGVSKITISPLERGFGTTIGNSLRRVLLSSIRGSAIVAVEVAGILHEFSSVPGMHEDMVNLILNLKAIGIRLEGEEHKSIHLKLKGPSKVLASALGVEKQVIVLTPNQEICTITDSREIEMTIVCDQGKGYVPAEVLQESSVEKKPGRIWIDAVFSPIKKVSFKVEETRVGQKIGYDKLLMYIESNGSVSAETALGLAAKVLQDQLQPLISFDLASEEEAHPKKRELPFDPVLLKKVDELDMSVRSQNCLKNVNIIYMGDLVTKTEAEMLKTPNFGRKSLNEIKEMLTSLGLHFGMLIPQWPPENLEEMTKQHKDECF
jgi:DNA-directed RNA polymerase subunit alpha